MSCLNIGRKFSPFRVFDFSSSFVVVDVILWRFATLTHEILAFEPACKLMIDSIDEDQTLDSYALVSINS